MEDVNEQQQVSASLGSGGALDAISILTGGTTGNSESLEKLSNSLKERVEKKEPEKESPIIRKEENLFGVTNKEKENVQETEEVEQKQEKEEDEFVIDSPLVGGKKSLKEKRDEKIEIENVEAVNEYIKKNFPEVEDFNSFASKYKEVNSKVEELNKVKEQYDLITSTIQSLPEELYTALVKFESGDDNWRDSIANKPRFDLKTDVNSISKKDLINAYFPGEISDEEFEASEKDSDDYNSYAERLIKTKHEMAKQKFEQEKQSKLGEAQRVMEQSKIKREKYESSVKSSVSNLQKKFPDLDTNTIKNVESTLLKDGVRGLFFDKEGNLLPDAASNFVMAQYGNDLLGQYQRLAEKKARTEANLEVLNKGVKTAPKLKNSREAKGDVRPEVMQGIENLKKMFFKPSGF